MHLNFCKEQNVVCHMFHKSHDDDIQSVKKIRRIRFRAYAIGFYTEFLVLSKKSLMQSYSSEGVKDRKQPHSWKAWQIKGNDALVIK